MILSHQKFDFGERRLIEKVTIQAPFRFSVDFPDDACFIYFEEGESKVNSPHEQIPVTSQESVLLTCGTYFSDLVAYPQSDLFKIFVVHLPKKILKEIYQYDIPSFSQSQDHNPFIQKIESQELIREYIKGLQFYFDHPGVVNDDILALKVKELILLLIQTRNVDSVKSLFQQLFTPQQIDIREVVNSHLFSNLSIEDLAGLCHLSLSTFMRQFKSLYDDTPGNYIKVKRLERARELLKLTTLTISEIAYDTCFSDVAHFSRSFKSAFDCSPSEYRQRSN